MGRVNEIKITKAVRRALEIILDERGKTSLIATATGIHKSQLSKYRTGATTSIPVERWEKLLPYLAPYLLPDKNNGVQVAGAVSGIVVDKNKGQIRQVNNLSASAPDALMDQILENQDLSAEAKIEMIKILKKEAKKQE